MGTVNDTVDDFDTILDEAAVDLEGTRLISGDVTSNEGGCESGGGSENGKSDDGRRTHFV